MSVLENALKLRSIKIKKEDMEVMFPLKSLGFGLGELRWLCRVALTATILDQNGQSHIGR